MPIYRMYNNQVEKVTFEIISKLLLSYFYRFTISVLQCSSRK